MFTLRPRRPIGLGGRWLRVFGYQICFLLFSSRKRFSNALRFSVISFKTPRQIANAVFYMFFSSNIKNMFAKFADIEKKQYLCTENVIFGCKNIPENVIFYTGNIYKM